MKTNTEVSKEFLNKLGMLFREYDAEIEAEDYWIGYGECGSDIRMEIYIPAIYENGECIRERTLIDLSDYFKGDALKEEG